MEINLTFLISPLQKRSKNCKINKHVVCAQLIRNGLNSFAQVFDEIAIYE